MTSLTVLDPSDLSAVTFRSAMRWLAGGVVVITVGEPGNRSGLTASSTSSLSLDPPTLVASINRNASAWPLIQRHRYFGVNVLSNRHVAIADAFAGRGGIGGEDRYRGSQWTTLVTGAPILANAPVAFDCVLDESIDRQSHSIVIGSVRAITRSDDGDWQPLVYWQGHYGSVRASA